MANERIRILLIDDDDMVRDLFRSILTDAGYEVVAAIDGAEGLRRIEEGGFDVVLTDILMPEKEGVSTILAMKKMRPGIGIIAISGGGRTRNLTPLRIAKKVGADLALSKPIEPNDLLKAVRKVAASG